MPDCLVILFALTLSWRPVHADRPLPKPHAKTACSPSKHLCARTDPVAHTTTARDQGTHELHWAIPGWRRWLVIANHGKTAVIGYQGVNLLPLDVSLCEPMLKFHSGGKFVRAITLGELYRRRTDMHRTTSHSAWVMTTHFNNGEQSVLELPDERTVRLSSRGPIRNAVRGGL